MANSNDITPDGLPSAPSGITNKFRKIIEDIVSEACDKYNRQTAALRLEVNTLSALLDSCNNEIIVLKEKIATLESRQDPEIFAMKALVIEQLEHKEKLNRIEKAYRNFFIGDSGLLYRLGHILSAFSQLSGIENPNSNDMLKAFSHFINMANNLTVLDSELTGIAQCVVVTPDIPIEELRSRLNTEDGERFYTELWHVCEPSLRRLCDQTRDERFNTPEAYDDLMADVKELLSGIRSCDIAIIPSPGNGFETLFDNSKSETTPSRPLVMRVSNRYVFTRGLYNDLKPYTTWE